MGVLIKDSYTASLLQSLHPRSEKMVGEKRGGDADILRGGEAVLERACRELHHGCRGSHGWRFSKVWTMC